MSDDETVERVARALAEDMDLDADDYYARKLARTALSAMPERELRYMDKGEQAIMSAALRASATVVNRDAALLREALEALEPFAKEYEYWVTDIPRALMLSDGNGALSPADIEWDAIVRARAAADKIRAALGGE